MTQIRNLKYIHYKGQESKQLNLYSPVCFYGMQLPLSHPYDVTRLPHTHRFSIYKVYTFGVRQEIIHFTQILNVSC